MPEPLTTYINDWRTTYGHILSDLHSVHNHLNNCAVQCRAESWEGLALSLELAAEDLEKASRHFMYGSPNLRTTMYYAMHWIDFNWPTDVEEYELTWQAICEAWAKDDFAGRAPTIAFIDRMRQLIWDEPFSVRWAARPEEQG